MKRFLVTVCIVLAGYFSFAQTYPVHLNSIGFLPKHDKTAAIPHRCKTFKVIDANSGEEIFSGETKGQQYQKDVDQQVWIADFSEVKRPGTYYIKVPGVGKSTEFEIAEDVYNFATKTAMRAFYLWRCGTAVHGKFKGDIFEYEACHLNDAWEDYIGNPDSQRDGTGGWHDAGDHGKYVVNAGVTLGVLFYAWDHFQNNLKKIDFELPETAPGFPEFLQENHEYKRFEQGDFKTGGYQTSDIDDRLWAAAEMWETTGNPDCLADFEKRAGEMNFEIDENWDWSDVSNLGMFTYALSKRKEKDKMTESAIQKNILANANALVAKAADDVYDRPLAGRYYWGCNGTVARQVVNLQVANQLQPKDAYIETALDAIDHIFGNNYYNRSYVTGLGLNPPMHPHDRRSGADDVKPPWPGYIVGGGHSATDWVDKEESYSHNEVAVNWQAALVYALAGFVN